MPRLPLDQHALPAAARQAVGQACRQAFTGPECQASAELLTSEVVTNAMLHAYGDVRLAVDINDTVVHVEVGDDAPDHPKPATAPADELAESGRGLYLVDVLASAWGVIALSRGKIVWFEVPSQP